MDEATVKENARRYLKSKGIFYADVQGSRFTTKGFPDMVAVINGLFIGLEFKTYRGKQSEDQKKFQRKLENAGGFYFLPKTLEDVKIIVEMFL